MKQGWEIKKLPDVVWFQEGPGVRKHQYTTSGVKLLNVANLVNGKVDLSTSDRYVSEEEAYGKYKHFLADEGDLILASSGIQVEYIEKKMGFIHKEHLPLCMNTSTIRFKPVDKECLNIRYFMYFLKSYNFKAQLYRLITGIAQLNFGPLHLKQMNIPVPPREEQERIVEELDCLSGVIEKKREQLKELDALAQSIFYQMFGDPITNEKGWEVKCLRDISTIGTGATPSREKEELYYGGEIHWVKTTEVQNCDIHSTEETITQLAVEQTNCKVYPQNTLLMAMYGQGKTRGQIARLKISAATNQACAAIMLDEARCILDFIYELLLIKYENIRAMAKGGNQANLNLKIVGSIPIILPPLALQQEFVDKIEAIEKQKELIKQSISKTEELFNSRMDYYFNRYAE